MSNFLDSIGGGGGAIDECAWSAVGECDAIGGLENRRAKGKKFEGEEEEEEEARWVKEDEDDGVAVTAGCLSLSKVVEVRA